MSTFAREVGLVRMTQHLEDSYSLDAKIAFEEELEADKYTIDTRKLMREIEKIHTSGVDRGISTGYKTLDPYYRVKKGELCIVTGNPGSGKSTFVDNLIMSLAVRKGWKFSIFSPENKPYQLHLRKMIEIHAGDSLYKELVPGDEDHASTQVKRMDPSKLATALQFCSDKFYWVNLPEPTMWRVTETWLTHLNKYNVDGVVLDPWNELETKRPPGMSETDWISQCLTLMREFARINQVAMWIVAHPAKIARNKDGHYPIPSLSDIVGSYAWRAKADVGIVVHRESITEHDVDIIVQKVRFKTSGQPGRIQLKYDYDSGRMLENVK